MDLIALCQFNCTAAIAAVLCCTSKPQLVDSRPDRSATQFKNTIYNSSFECLSLTSDPVELLVAGLPSSARQLELMMGCSHALSTRPTLASKPRISRQLKATWAR